MKDIKRILELNLALYKKYDIPIANLEEFVFILFRHISGFTPDFIKAEAW